MREGLTPFAVGPIQLDVIQMGTHAIAFLCLLWILKRFAWKPLLAMLDERRQRIAQGLADIERQREEVKRIQEEYARRITQIEEEARQKIQAAVRDGQRVGRQIQEEARDEARKLLEKTREDLALEIAKAKVDLKGEIVGLTLASTERLLRERLDDAHHQRFVERLIDELSREGKFEG